VVLLSADVFTNRAGLTIALQGIGGNAGSDFGMSFGAQQTFMETASSHGCN